MVSFIFNLNKDYIKCIDLRNYLIKNSDYSRLISSNQDEQVEFYEMNESTVILKKDSQGRILEGLIAGSPTNAGGLIKELNLRGAVRVSSDI